MKNLYKAAVLAGVIAFGHGVVRGHEKDPKSFTFSPGLTRAEQIEQAIDERIWALSNVTCHEETERYEVRGSATRETGILETNVEVLNGSEKYSAIRMNQKKFPDMHHVPGTWSVGEMVTLLQVTRDAIDAGQVQFADDETADLGKTVIMTFTYPAYSQRWYLKVKSQLHWMPFEGRVWESPETGEILRVTWRAASLPADIGVSEVTWTVDFKSVDISSLVMTLPTEARYQVTYRSGGNRIDRNVTHFSEYRRYGSDSAIRFEDVQAGE